MEEDAVKSEATSEVEDVVPELGTRLLHLRQERARCLHYAANGSLLTSERVRGMPEFSSSGMTCCGVRDDATLAVSGGAGPAGGLRGAV